MVREQCGSQLRTVQVQGVRRLSSAAATTGSISRSATCFTTTRAALASVTTGCTTTRSTTFTVAADRVREQLQL